MIHTPQLMVALQYGLNRIIQHVCGRRNIAAIQEPAIHPERSQQMGIEPLLQTDIDCLKEAIL